MKNFITVLFLLLSVLVKSQHTFLIGTGNITSFIDKETILPDYKFQINSRVGLSYFTPLKYDSTTQKEILGLGIGAGSFFNSFYHTKSSISIAKNTVNLNSIRGVFLNVEPYYNFFHSNNNKLKIHASINFLVYLFYNNETINGASNRDSSRFEQTSLHPKNNFQLGIEPSLGISYYLQQSKSGLLFRLKGGPVIHNKAVSRLSTSKGESSSPKLNDYQISFSVGLKLKSKK